MMQCSRQARDSDSAQLSMSLSLPAVAIYTLEQQTLASWEAENYKYLLYMLDISFTQLWNILS
jgi:hypothetical protein